MSWPFSAYIIDHVSAGPIYQNTRGAEMLITALRCPVLKPMRWGKGLSEGTTIHFVSKHGWAWHLMQFFFYKWSPCYYVDVQNQWRNSTFNLLGLGNYRNDSPLTTQTHCFKTHGTVLSSSFGNSKKWETKPLKVIFRRTSFTHKMPDASHLALTPAMHEPGSP